jgi:hypothetical protein
MDCWISSIRHDLRALSDLCTLILVDVWKFIFALLLVVKILVYGNTGNIYIINFHAWFNWKNGTKSRMRIHVAMRPVAHMNTTVLHNKSTVYQSYLHL